MSSRVATAAPGLAAITCLPVWLASSSRRVRPSRAIVAQPQWLGALAVVTLAIAVAQYAFLSTKVGQDAMVDQQIHQTEAMGRQRRPQAQIDGIEQRGAR